MYMYGQWKYANYYTNFIKYSKIYSQLGETFISS